MEDAAARKARLKALRQEAAGAGDGGDREMEAAAEAPAEAAPEPVLKFRNYAVKDEKSIEFKKVEAAQAPEFEDVVVDPDALLGSADAEEVLINVAPKKANWDLRRDVADKMSKLERRTQVAMVKLMQQEEARRLEEEGGAQD